MPDTLPVLPTYLFVPSVAGVLSLVLTVLLPILAALFMRASWPTPVKGTVLILVAAVKTFLEAWLIAVQTNVPFNGWGIAYTVIINFGIAVVAYFGILKDSSVQLGALTSGPVRDPATQPPT